MDDKQTNATPAADADKSAPDFEALLAEKDAKIAKLSEERENYRLGMLKAKGKLPTDGTAPTPEGLDEMIKAKVQEELAESNLFQAQREKDSVIAQMAKDLKEAKVALASRGQVSSSPSGTSQDTKDVKTQFFADEQLPEIRKSYDRARMQGGNVGTFEEYVAKVKGNLPK
jgi:hypothetical protein